MFMKQLVLIVIKGKFQVQYWNVINFPSMWLIQTKQGSKRWLESLDLCLDSSRSYKRNKKSVDLALVYWVMKQSLLLKAVSWRRQHQKLKNLPKKMNIGRFHSRKMVFCTTKEGYLQQKGQTTVMKHLCLNTFCVTVIYKHSPLVCSIVNKTHWHFDATKHLGVETVWRYFLKLGYKMQGIDLVKKVKKNCERCRYLKRKAVNIEMGRFISQFKNSTSI